MSEKKEELIPMMGVKLEDPYEKKMNELDANLTRLESKVDQLYEVLANMGLHPYTAPK